MNFIGTCKDRNNNNISVVISTGGSGDDREITIMQDGIHIDYDSDGIFKPLKKSGASIEILTEYIVNDFYTGTLLDPEVYIYRNNELIWFGYISPTIFTQPFVNQKEPLTLECIDTLANLEYIDYKYLQSATSVVSLIDIISGILDKTDPSANIKSIFYTQSLSVNNSNDILSQLAVLERNFSDEIEDVMKCDEVIEEICKFLGVCMFQYKDAYYIVDYSNLSSGFTQYNRSSSTSNELTSTPISISQIGVGSNDASITLDGVYNKITVIANTLKSSNPIESSSESTEDNTTTDLFNGIIANSETSPYDTNDIWVNPDIDRNDRIKFSLGGLDFMDGNRDYNNLKDNVWDIESHEGWNHYKLLTSWFKLGPQWNIQYDGIAWATQDGIGTTVEVYNGPMSFSKATETFLNSRSREYRWAPTFQWNSNNVKNDGVVVQKTFFYDADGEVPTEYKWETYLTAPLKHRHSGLEDYLIKLEKSTAPYKGGSLIINFEFMFTDMINVAAPSLFPEINSVYDDTISTSFTAFSGQPVKTKERKIVFPAKLRIGNHYWDGHQWKTYTEQFLTKLNAGYFNKSISCIDYDREGTEYFYRVWNNYWNGWEYCTQSRYESYNGTKERIELENYTDTYWQPGTIHTTELKYIVKDTTNNTVFNAPQEYYDEYISDRFFLAKKFDNGDQMYGKKYKLTNTTSYDMNLTNGSEGIAISLPEGETFTGDFEFSFSRPTRHFEALTPGCKCGESISGIVMHISDLYVKYSTVDSTQSVFEKKNTNNDITYSNVIDNGYIQEYDDIQLKINTYNSTIPSFSYILDVNNEYVENILYNGESKKMEKHLIDKYVNHFSTPKFKYCGTLHDVNITPCSILHQSQLNKNLAVYKANYNILMNTVEVESVEV